MTLGVQYAKYICSCEYYHYLCIMYNFKGHQIVIRRNWKTRYQIIMDVLKHPFARRDQVLIGKDELIQKSCVAVKTTCIQPVSISSRNTGRIFSNRWANDSFLNSLEWKYWVIHDIRTFRIATIIKRHYSRTPLQWNCVCGQKTFTIGGFSL